MGSSRLFGELLAEVPPPVKVEVRCQACGRRLGTYHASIGHEELREGRSLNEGIALRDPPRKPVHRPGRYPPGMGLSGIGNGLYYPGAVQGARAINHNAWVDPETNRYHLSYEWRCGCGAHIKRRSTRLGKLPVHKDRGKVVLYLI